MAEGNKKPSTLGHFAVCMDRGGRSRQESSQSLAFLFWGFLVVVILFLIFSFLMLAAIYRWSLQ